MKRPVIVIPAYNPEGDKLISLVKEVTSLNVERVIVINDGSRGELRPCFDALAGLPDTVVLHHRENRGKGAALKTGFRHVLQYRVPCSAVITMDADGQHLVADVEKVLEASLDEPEALILGVRQFTGKVPLRSLMGNKLTYLLFRGLVGRKITDTQTGLRGIPHHFLDRLLALSSDRYDYELEMLLTLVQEKSRIVQVPISTVYENGNSISSFRPVADSMQVYRILFLWWFTFRFKQMVKYSLSGGLSTIADFGTYIILINLSCGFVTASMLARILSTLIHFSSNKYFTFAYKDAPQMGEVVKYLSVVAFNLTGSIFLIHLFVTYLALGEIVAKVAAQLLLFFATYTLLNGFVFLRERKEIRIRQDRR